MGEMECGDEACLEEKKLFKNSIDRLRGKNSNLVNEK